MSGLSGGRSSLSVREIGWCTRSWRGEACSSVWVESGKDVGVILPIAGWLWFELGIWREIPMAEDCHCWIGVLTVDVDRCAEVHAPCVYLVSVIVARARRTTAGEGTCRSNG